MPVVFDSVVGAAGLLLKLRLGDLHSLLSGLSSSFLGEVSLPIRRSATLDRIGGANTKKAVRYIDIFFLHNKSQHVEAMANHGYSGTTRSLPLAFCAPVIIRVI